MLWIRSAAMLWKTSKTKCAAVLGQEVLQTFAATLGDKKEGQMRGDAVDKNLNSGQMCGDAAGKQKGKVCGDAVDNICSDAVDKERKDCGDAVDKKYGQMCGDAGDRK